MKRIEDLEKRLAALEGTWGKLGGAIEKYGPKLEKLMDQFGVKMPSDVKAAIPGAKSEEPAADPKAVTKKRGRFGW